MKTLNTEFNIGTKVIVVEKYGAVPSISNVTRLTATGQLYVRGMDKTRFKVVHSGGTRAEESNASRYPHRHINVYVFSEEKFEELKGIQIEMQITKDMRKKREEARVAAIEKQRVEELQVAKEAVGELEFEYTKIYPDGSRLYLIEIPINEQYPDKQFEVIVIRCKDVEVTDYETYKKEMVVEAAYSYATARSHSFASCSTSQYTTDEEAIWDAIRQEYNSWS